MTATPASTHDGGAGTWLRRPDARGPDPYRLAPPAVAIPHPLAAAARGELLDRLVGERVRLLVACSALGVQPAAIDAALAALTGAAAAELVKQARAEVFDDLCSPRRKR